MPDRKAKRIRRKLPGSQLRKYDAMRAKLDGELPEILAQGRRIRAEAEAARQLRQAATALDTARAAQGMSVDEVCKKTGISRATLARLEQDPDVRPSLSTLSRYAAGLGKKLRILVEDQ